MNNRELVKMEWVGPGYYADRGHKEGFDYPYFVRVFRLGTYSIYQAEIGEELFIHLEPPDDMIVEYPPVPDEGDLEDNLMAVYKIIQEYLSDVEQLRLIQMLLTPASDGPISEIEKPATDGAGPSAWAAQAQYVLGQAMRVMSDDQLSEIGGQRVIRLLVEEAPVAEIQRLVNTDSGLPELKMNDFEKRLIGK